MGHWSDMLIEIDACEPAIKWARTQESYEVAWAECTSPSWMLWLIGRLSGDAGSNERRRLVLLACDIAEHDDRYDPDCLADVKCLETARNWAHCHPGVDVADLEVVHEEADSVAVMVAVEIAFIPFGSDAHVLVDQCSVGEDALVALETIRRHYPTPPALP